MEFASLEPNSGGGWALSILSPTLWGEGIPDMTEILMTGTLSKKLNFKNTISTRRSRTFYQSGSNFDNVFFTLMRGGRIQIPLYM